MNNLKDNNDSKNFSFFKITKIILELIYFVYNINNFLLPSLNKQIIKIQTAMFFTNFINISNIKILLYYVVKLKSFKYFFIKYKYFSMIL